MLECELGDGESLEPFAMADLSSVSGKLRTNGMICLNFEKCTIDANSMNNFNRTMEQIRVHLQSYVEHCKATKEGKARVGVTLPQEPHPNNNHILAKVSQIKRGAGYILKVPNFVDTKAPATQFDQESNKLYTASPK